MLSWFPGPGKRARRELEQLHKHISHRLDRLESTPPAEDHLTTQLEELSRKVAETAYLAGGSQGEVIKLQGQMKELVLAVDEGIARTDRAERRIRAVVQRCRTELKRRGMEDPGLEAEANEFRDVDAERGESDGVPALQPGVDGPAQKASSIRGVPLELLRRVRGI